MDILSNHFQAKATLEMRPFTVTSLQEWFTFPGKKLAVAVEHREVGRGRAPALLPRTGRLSLTFAMSFFFSPVQVLKGQKTLLSAAYCWEPLMWEAALLLFFYYVWPLWTLKPTRNTVISVLLTEQITPFSLFSLWLWI